jgi:hypothetical protein
MHLANNKKIYFALISILRQQQHLVCQEKSDSWHGSMRWDAEAIF